MAMHYLQVFLNEDALVQLEDEFVDKEDDLRHLIYTPVKNLAKSAKMILLNKQFVANVMDDDQKQTTETIKLKDFKLDKFAPKSDPDWRPENVTDSEAKPYKIRVGDKTWDLLETSFKIYNARIDLYNKSLDKDDKNYEKNKAEVAECWEKIIHENLIGPVMQKIDKSIEKELDSEFKEVYEGKKDKAAKKKDKRNPKKPS